MHDETADRSLTGAERDEPCRRALGTTLPCMSSTRSWRVSSALACLVVFVRSPSRCFRRPLVRIEREHDGIPPPALRRPPCPTAGTHQGPYRFMLQLVAFGLARRTR
jgi:hypothetical protein